MIRLAIVGESLSLAERLAARFTEDDEIEVVAVISVAKLPGPGWLETADVALLTSVAATRVLFRHVRAVLLTDELPRLPISRDVLAYLPPTASDAELRAAILAAGQGLTVLTKAQAALWLPRGSATASDAVDAASEQVTRREAEVLRMLADGLANKEIATRLGISTHTAKYHVAQILAKLGAASRAEAVTIGVRRGLIPV